MKLIIHAIGLLLLDTKFKKIRNINPILKYL